MGPHWQKDALPCIHSDAYTVEGKRIKTCTVATEDHKLNNVIKVEVQTWSHTWKICDYMNWI